MLKQDHKKASGSDQTCKITTDSKDSKVSLLPVLFFLGGGGYPC